MGRIVLGSLPTVLFLGSSTLFLAAQGGTCRLLDPESGRKFLPDRVPMETESIQVDDKNFSVLEFPDKTRAAIAALLYSGLSAEMQKKYQYVLVSETRLKLERASIPAGMVSLSPEAGSDKDAPTRILVARDFLGSEIERITMKMDPNAPDTGVSFTPKGANAFELHIGKYMLLGAQK